MSGYLMSGRRAATPEGHLPAPREEYRSGYSEMSHAEQQRSREIAEALRFSAALREIFDDPRPPPTYADRTAAGPAGTLPADPAVVVAFSRDQAANCACSVLPVSAPVDASPPDRKSTRLNSS